MLVQQKEKLQKIVDIVDHMEVNPDINIEYFIPGVIVTAAGGDESSNPYIQFNYAVDGIDSHTQQVPLTRSNLEKTPEDLANLVTFSLEQFMGEVDSRQYGAQ